MPATAAPSDFPAAGRRRRAGWAVPVTRRASEAAPSAGGRPGHRGTSTLVRPRLGGLSQGPAGTPPGRSRLTDAGHDGAVSDMRGGAGRLVSHERPRGAADSHAATPGMRMSRAGH